MKKENIKYKALTAIRYLGDGFFYPFFALYLVSRGLLEAKIGFILSISPLLAIILNPIYAKICNKIKTTKITLGIISILEGLMILLIGFSSDFYFITGLAILMAIFGACHYGLMDSLLAIYCDNSKQNYSGFRLFGSASYIIATAVGGYVCKLVSYQVAFGVSFLLFTISGILYLLLKDIHIEEEHVQNKKDSTDYKVVLTNKRFIFFMFFYGLMLALIFTNSNFLGTYLETRGVDSDGYGLVFSYFVAVELVKLLILNKINKKVSPYILLIISAFTLAIRILVCYLYAPVWLVIATSGLRGIGYGIMLHVSYQYIIDLVGEDKATKGIMLCTLVYAILWFIFNNVNGNLIEAYGYKSYFLINFIASCVLLLYSFLIPLLNKKKEEVTEEQIEK